MDNNERQSYRTAARQSTIRRSANVAVIAAAVFGAMHSGCTSQTMNPASPATGTPSAAAPMPQATELVTAEISESGDIVSVTDANGTLLPKLTGVPSKDHRSPGERYYVFGMGMSSIPGGVSVPAQAFCLIENGQQGRGSNPPGWCWPKDRPAWLQLDSRGIRDVYYKSNSGHPEYARPPVGPLPSSIRRIEYAPGLKHQENKQAPGGQLQEKAFFCNMTCVGNYCYCR
jgi:hypothetical protein